MRHAHLACYEMLELLKEARVFGHGLYAVLGIVDQEPLQNGETVLECVERRGVVALLQVNFADLTVEDHQLVLPFAVAGLTGRQLQ
jgi:hypothetical protein